MNNASSPDNTHDQVARLLSGTVPELGRGPRANVKGIADIDAQLAQLKTLPGATRQAVRSLLLLWHDHWDPAHGVAQDLLDANGSYLHGMAHRREPDYWNAKYWFRRVTAHPTWPTIAGEARALRESGAEFKAFDLGGSPGRWEPLAFVDFVEAAARLPAEHSQHRFAREVQAIEFRCLLRHFLAPKS